MKQCLCGCGSLIPPITKARQPARFKHGHNTTGAAHYNWKSGPIIHSAGYRLIKSPNHRRADRNHYVLEHIVVYEQFHKCCMLLFGVIHHVNGNRSDNRIENLQAMTHKEHSKHHNRIPLEIINQRVCAMCGSKNTYRKKNGSYMWFFIKNTRKPLCSRCYDKHGLIEELHLVQ